MLKKLALKIITAAMIVILSNVILFAQTEEERVKFGRGKNSATISNNISAGQLRTYTLYVKKGQKITVKVRSGNDKVEVDTANFSAGQFEERGNKFLSLPIDQTGDYQVYVRNFGKTTTKFTLTVTVR